MCGRGLTDVLLRAVGLSTVVSGNVRARVGDASKGGKPCELERTGDSRTAAAYGWERVVS